MWPVQWIWYKTFYVQNGHQSHQSKKLPEKNVLQTYDVPTSTYEYVSRYKNVLYCSQHTPKIYYVNEIDL